MPIIIILFENKKSLKNDYTALVLFWHHATQYKVLQNITAHIHTKTNINQDAHKQHEHIYMSNIYTL